MISSDGQLVTRGESARGLRHRHPELTRAIYIKANNRRARYIYIRVERVRAMQIAKQDTLYCRAIKSTRQRRERFSLFANSDLIIAADSTERSLLAASEFTRSQQPPADIVQQHPPD